MAGPSMSEAIERRPWWTWELRISDVILAELPDPRRTFQELRRLCEGQRTEVFRELASAHQVLRGDGKPPEELLEQSRRIGVALTAGPKELERGG